MTYLVAADLPAEPAGARFRALLARPRILQLPARITDSRRCRPRLRASRRCISRVPP